MPGLRGDIMPYLGSEDTVRELKRVLSNPNIQSDQLRYRKTVLKVIRWVSRKQSQTCLRFFGGLFENPFNIKWPVYYVHLIQHKLIISVSLKILFGGAINIYMCTQ